MIKKLKSIIDKSEIVSFDIFDTLVYRYTNKPSDVFSLIEEYYNKNSKDKIKNFKDIRIKAERSARNKKSKEITIDDIYNEIYRVFDDKKEKLKNLEINVEKALCYKNKEMAEVLDYATKNKKKIIIISDMYLDKKDIEIILNNLNIKYDKLYLSSEIGKTKSAGTLIKYVIQDLKINPKKIIHIGDNVKNDYLIPKMYGGKTYVIHKKKLKNLDINKTILLNFIESKLKEKKNKTEFYKFGYKNLGPLLYGFCKMLKEEYIKNNIENMIFLAREGKIIKESFDMICENKMKTSYMYISRKSVSSSIIHNKVCDKNSIIKLQSVALNETVKMFLSRFNLINDNNINLLKLLGLELDNQYRKLEVKEKIMKNFDKFISNSEMQEDRFYNYLKTFNITNKTSIVDIGWNGTMQDLIQMELNKDKILIQGYYLGMRKDRKNKYKHGFIFDGDDEEKEILSRGMVGLLEIIFAADHGTTLSYNQDYKPKLDKVDINDFTYNSIAEIQDGAKQFIKEFSNSKINNYLNLITSDYSYNIYSVGTNPKLKDIKLLDNIYTFNEKSKKLIGGKFIFRYLFNPKKLKSDFQDSGWKIAFLKKLFKIPISYKKIYIFIYKKCKRLK